MLNQVEQSMDNSVISVRDAREESAIGKKVTLQGWVRTRRDSKAGFSFIEINDGSSQGNIQIIASDHAPHTWESKCKKYPESPSGMPMVENTLALMLDQVNQGQCTLEQVVEWMCHGPAKLWDIVDKGRIQVGYDADLVLVDMNKTAVIENARQETKCKWSAWHGKQLTGWPVRTWVVGHEVFRDGEIDDSRRGVEVMFEHERGGYWAEEES